MNAPEAERLTKRADDNFAMVCVFLYLAGVSVGIGMVRQTEGWGYFFCVVSLVIAARCAFNMRAAWRQLTKGCRRG